MPPNRTPVLRSEGGHERSQVGMVELFFDLVFVFAITQLSHGLLEHLTPLGALHTGLHQAWRQALAVPRAEARQRAEAFGWAAAAHSFAGFLVPARRSNAANLAKRFSIGLRSGE